jgi:hypothetical protein
MTWNEDDVRRLLLFKDKSDADEVRIKEIIKQNLLNDKYILHVLDNKELEKDLEDDGTGADAYFGENILPFYNIMPTQSATSTFICYEVSCEKDRYAKNNGQKKLRIIFYVLVDQKIIYDKDTGIAKHDLLSALIQNKFNYTNYFGRKIHLISNVPSVTDNQYSCRTLIFEQLTDDNVVKSFDMGYGFETRFANKDTVY